MNNQLSTTERLSTEETVLVRHVVPSMVLAPSAHNTQPWHFAITSNAVDIFVDWNRHLTISDPSHRELFVSIGCAIANGVLAGEYWGQIVAVQYFPTGEKKDAAVARLVFTKAAVARKDRNELFSAIEKRRTNRALYDAKPLTKIEKGKLVIDASTIVTDDRKKIEAIADLTEEGTVATLSRTDFKEELSHWVRNNWTWQNDGMPGYAMGMPAPISLLGSLMVRLAPIHKQEGPKSHDQIASASTIAVIATPTDTPQDWMKAGIALENIWLEATTADIAVAPLVSAIEASAELRQQLQKVLGTSLLPQSLIRLGHAPTHDLRHTPRRSLEDCLK